MTNPRDTGRWDAIAQEYVDQQVQIDFAWGNLPIQPNDDRGENELVYELDSHNIAIDGWAGYPLIDDLTVSLVPEIPMPANFAQYAALLAAADLVAVQGENLVNHISSELEGQVSDVSPAPGTLIPVGTEVTVRVLAAYTPNTVAVPNISGMPWPQANTTITNAGFVVGTVVTDVDTSNMSIANTVASQSPAAGTQAALGSAVAYHLYNYVAPATTGPIAGFSRTTYGHFNLNGNESVMFLIGRTVKPTIGDTISVTGSSDSSHNVTWTVADVANDDSYNTGGTAVRVTLVSGTISQDTSSGGTWTKL